MILSSLTALVLAAASTVSPISNGHMQKQPDSRVTLTLANDSNSFMDVNIAGHVYEIAAHERLVVKGPAGTGVFAASRTSEFKRGDLMTALTPEANRQTMDVR